MISVSIGEYKINFSEEAVSILDEFTQRKKNQPEAGGIILGTVNSKNVEILRLSPPTELDKATRFNFERHRLSAQIVVNYEFYNSNKRVTYLGEWHTHPEDFPSPSGIDIKMINQQLNGNELHIDFLLLVIKGRKGLYVGVYHDNFTLCKEIKL